MMKDEEFDVIILEFFMRAMDGLKTLATRIRHRFPGKTHIITFLFFYHMCWKFYSTTFFIKITPNPYAIENFYFINPGAIIIILKLW